MNKILSIILVVVLSGCSGTETEYYHCDRKSVFEDIHSVVFGEVKSMNPIYITIDGNNVQIDEFYYGKYEPDKIVVNDEFKMSAKKTKRTNVVGMAKNKRYYKTYYFSLEKIKKSLTLFVQERLIDENTGQVEKNTHGIDLEYTCFVKK